MDDESTEEGKRLSAEEISQYLVDEERCLAESLLEAFQNGVELPSEATSLSGSVDLVCKQIQGWLQEKIPPLGQSEFDRLIAHVNGAFRRYEEALERCATQLYSELEKVRIDRLSDSILENVAKIRAQLVKQVNQAVSEFRRLEGELSAYSGRFSGRWGLLSSFRKFFKSTLERHIGHKIGAVHQIAEKGFSGLERRRQQYQELVHRVRKKLEKFTHYPQLKNLPAQKQQQFTELYRLLKLRQLAPKISSALVKEINRIIQETISTPGAQELLRFYYKALDAHLYEVRAQFVSMVPEGTMPGENRREILQALSMGRREVHTLGSVIYRFRDFLLRTHPDPYVRARLGFAERTVAPEPELTHGLMKLGNKVEGLGVRYERFAEAVEEYKVGGPTAEELGYFDELIDRLEWQVREVKNPDGAADAYRHLLAELEEIEELYCFDVYRVMGMEKILRMALRMDRFNVLVNERQFRSIYEIHRKIRGEVRGEQARKSLVELAHINEELETLRVDTESHRHTARSIASDQIQSWIGGAQKLLESLDQFVKEQRKNVPIPFEDLTGVVRFRRHEVTDFLFSLRVFMKTVRRIQGEVPESLYQLLEWVNRIEVDFVYLQSHYGKGHGPLTLTELQGLESL